MPQKRRSSSDYHHSCCNAHFMQPLLPDFLNAFAIPVSFSEHLMEELKGHQPETVVLTTEQQPWRHWIVEVESGRHFKKGWKEFCSHHHLQVGEFLVFRHHSNLLFYVSVYDPASACERRRGAMTALPSALSQNPTYNLTLTPYYVSRGSICPPMAFVRSSGLYKRKCNITVVDGEGRSWNTNLNFKTHRYSGYIYGSGWRNLTAANDFKAGDVISFQLLKAGDTPVVKCSRIVAADENPKKLG